jgi:hypothetical protein
MPQRLVHHLVTTCARLHEQAQLQWYPHAHKLVLVYSCIPRHK